ncbi:MAG: cation transporter [Betaproteobacteria bacterium]|nr:cation transporter [Betaproteobacteria bacterium]NBT75106.1 cation transporter [Betaproteobacteria bacterium]NCA17577.1 cation transporter [Betaproteobacteria bacterium]
MSETVTETLTDQQRSAIEARALGLCLAITASFAVFQLLAGIYSGSLALISDSAHMATDCVGLATALFATHLTHRGRDTQHTYGYHRLEVLSATFNALLLVGLAVFLVMESLERLKRPSDLSGEVMLTVATVGLAVNLLCVFILRKTRDGSLNARAASLEVASDALSSVGVIVAALMVLLLGWTWVDSAVGLGIAAWAMPRAIKLLRASIHVLLEAVPAGIEVHEVQMAIRQLPEVLDVHDVHIWSLSSQRSALTAHLRIREHSDQERVIVQVNALLRRRFQIAHTTLQLETGEHCPSPHHD